MKTTRTLTLTGFAFLSVLIIYSCKKSDVLKSDSTDPADVMAKNSYQNSLVQLDNGSVVAGGVTLTYPAQVGANKAFNILAEIDCGKVSIERGFITASNGTKIYKNLTCNSANLDWESIVNFQCYADDASWTGSLAEAGTYVFRTKHNATAQSCGQGSTNCSFNGNQEYCFSIEVLDGCTTSFSGEAKSCGTSRKAVYSFKSKDAQSYVKIQGGLTNFTGADAVVEVTGGNFGTPAQWTPGGSSNRIIKLEGSVGACEQVTITITWNSTNSGGVITGDWSVKGIGGNDIAPAVAGLTCSN